MRSRDADLLVWRKLGKEHQCLKFEIADPDMPKTGRCQATVVWSRSKRHSEMCCIINARDRMVVVKTECGNKTLARVLNDLLGPFGLSFKTKSHFRLSGPRRNDCGGMQVVGNRAKRIRMEEIARARTDNPKYLKQKARLAQRRIEREEEKREALRLEVLGELERMKSVPVMHQEHSTAQLRAMTRAKEKRIHKEMQDAAKERKKKGEKFSLRPLRSMADI